MDWFESETLALLKVLAENSFDSVLITDASIKGKIIYANKSFKKLNPLEAARKLQAMRIPVETVYPQVGAKLGLLEETTAQAVVSFYSVLSGLRTMVAVPMPELEPTAAADGLYTIAGGEKVEAALFQAERLIPEIIELGSVAANKLTRA